MPVDVELPELTHAFPEEREDSYCGEMSGKRDQTSKPQSPVEEGGPYAPAWHSKVGWWAIGIAIFFFGFGANRIYIQMPNDAREERRQDREDIRREITAAVAEGNAPLREKLAAIAATLELMKPEAGKRLGAAMRESLGDRDLALGLKTVEALAHKAKQRGIAGDPRDLAPVQAEIQRVRSANLTDALNATTALLDYRSSLNQSPAPTASPLAITASTGEGDMGYVYFAFSMSPDGPPAVPFVLLPSAKNKLPKDVVPTVFPLLPITGPKGEHDGSMIEPLAGRSGPFIKYPVEFTGGRRMIVTTPPGVSILLDGFRFRNIVFRDANVSFSGKFGTKLDDVQFSNCTFSLGAESLGTSFPQAVMAPGPLVQM